MSTNLLCKVCGYQYPAVQVPAGHRVECPSCQSPFVPESLLHRASQAAQNNPPAAAPSRTILAPLDEPIRYVCPKCKKSLESPRNMAGEKLNCPACGQRLQIPQPPAALPPQNKTLLALEHGSPALAPPPAAPPPLITTEVIEVVDVAREAPAPPIHHCLECGRGVVGSERLLTCPDCGSTFCSAGCMREHSRFAHGQRPRKRRSPAPSWSCPFCGTREQPYYREEISPDAWVVFVILLIVFFPVCWIPLVAMKSRYDVCYDCGRRV